jgi:hypothetical protein
MHIKITVLESDGLLEQYVTATDPEYGGTTFLRNIDKIHYTIRRQSQKTVIFINLKSIAIPVTRRGSPYGCETSRLPRFPDNRVTVAMSYQPYAPAVLYSEESWYTFLLEAESPQGHRAAGRIRWIEKSNDLIRNRTRGLPTCSIVPPNIISRFWEFEISYIGMYSK